MRVIRKINNNAVVCIDENGSELVAFGKGLGFHKVPYELQDMSAISRTYYGVSRQQIKLLNEIDKIYFDVAGDIVDYASTKIQAGFSSSVVFALADHISFAVSRYRKNMYVKAPKIGDIRLNYEAEYNLGVWAVGYINKRFKVKLAKEEAVSIALHFINGEKLSEKQVEKERKYENCVNDIVSLIEKYFDFDIDRNSFNYSRFEWHLRYLLKRIETKEPEKDQTGKMLDALKKQYPEIYGCAVKISDYTRKTLGYELSRDEIVYLMLHINRLWNRENS